MTKEQKDWFEDNGWWLDEIDGYVYRTGDFFFTVKDYHGSLE